MSTITHAINVHEDVYKKLPGLMLITGRAKVDPTQVNESAIKAFLTESWQNLQKTVADETSEGSRRIQQWCDELKQSGVSIKDYPPSIKAIAKRALKGGDVFSIHPIVDTYNAISMSLALPFGAYESAAMDGELRIRLSAGGEGFVGLGSDKDEPTVPGEIVFSDDHTVLTRMFLWRQSGKGKITPETREFIFICELAGSMGRDVAEKARDFIERKLVELLGAEISDMEIQTA